MEYFYLIFIHDTTASATKLLPRSSKSEIVRIALTENSGPVQMDFREIPLIRLTADDFRGMYFLSRVDKKLRNGRIGTSRYSQIPSLLSNSI